VLIETEDMRRIVIDASDVLTVLKREKKPRGAEASAVNEPFIGDVTGEELPPDLAKLEDTIDVDVPPDSLSSGPTDFPDTNGSSD
jgi:hypothetical protein